MKPEKQKRHAALRALLIALLTLALLAAGFAAYRLWWLPRAGFAVHFVDIGQGDEAIVVCDGKTLVIDGGMPESGAKLVDYLQNTLHVSTIDAMIGTHPHADHIGGLPDVIRAFAVKTLYSPVDEFEGKPFEAMKRAADAKNVRITVPQAGQRFSLGRAEVEFYAPLGIYDDVNDLSLVTRITYGQTAFLFTGDAESIAFGVMHQRTTTPFFFLLAYSHCMAAIFRGAGKSTVPMLVMMLCWCIIRVIYVTVAVKFFPVLRTVSWAYPITWGLSTLVFTLYYFKADWMHAFERREKHA